MAEMETVTAPAPREAPQPPADFNWRRAYEARCTQLSQTTQQLFALNESFQLAQVNIAVMETKITGLEAELAEARADAEPIDQDGNTGIHTADQVGDNTVVGASSTILKARRRK